MLTWRELYELTGHVILSTYNKEKYDKEVTRNEILDFLRGKSGGHINYNNLHPKIREAIELKRA